MRVFTLDPLLDPRWLRFVDRHPRASIFHTSGWLEALYRTYGYEPAVYTTASPQEELENGIVFCTVDSWLTGRRLVSLPFSDHCEPLADTQQEWELLTTAAIEQARCEGYGYVEIRPLAKQPEPGGRARMVPSESFYLHTLDLRPNLHDLFRTFHKSCVQRKVRRAEREGVYCTQGRSRELVRQFYRLLTATRRRHQIPPQPLEWFDNLTDCLGDLLTIYVARREGQPIASIVLLWFKDRVYYKYGCSDERFHNLGAVQFLFWKAIQDSKERDVHVFDLGRSDVEGSGLATFKAHWGSTRSLLTYYRYPPTSHVHNVHKWAGRAARYAFARLPDSMLTRAGRFLYPHIG